MPDRTKLLHSAKLLHRHNSLVCNGFLDFGHIGVKLVKHFSIIRMEKINFYIRIKRIGKMLHLLHCFTGGVYG